MDKIDMFKYLGKPRRPTKEIKRKRVNYTLIDF